MTPSRTLSLGAALKTVNPALAARKVLRFTVGRCLYFLTAYQNVNFSASWIIRAAFSVPLTWPPDELLTAVDGAENVG